MMCGLLAVAETDNGQAAANEGDLLKKKLKHVAERFNIDINDGFFFSLNPAESVVRQVMYVINKLQQAKRLMIERKAMELEGEPGYYAEEYVRSTDDADTSFAGELKQIFARRNKRHFGRWMKDIMEHTRGHSSLYNHVRRDLGVIRENGVRRTMKLKRRHAKHDARHVGRHKKRK